MASAGKVTVTGKTQASVDRAVEMINKNVADDDEETKRAHTFQFDLAVGNRKRLVGQLFSLS